MPLDPTDASRNPRIIGSGPGVAELVIFFAVAGAAAAPKSRGSGFRWASSAALAAYGAMCAAIQPGRASPWTALAAGDRQLRITPLRTRTLSSSPRCAPPT